MKVPEQFYSEQGKRLAAMQEFFQMNSIDPTEAIASCFQFACFWAQNLTKGDPDLKKHIMKMVEMIYDAIEKGER